ncbi:heterokaryon incompatibility protein [Colletotrichum graminicola M1.001]|uniref:Heterokaryon incompatibility protein n=1 Tax=Colletotrichum graminicola (strain M1.001 / M2 / FGSC 10212) TaxID=645133 RepID=E3Q8Q1_COLGM|nr:heterokaryon incompatibility protein [Colletotrichum graminicola M1.001]EFQ27415.1 heterokaryon incompatibility protein [Colletotrichum graminicola M1.001]
MLERVEDELRTAPLKPCNTASHVDASVGPKINRPPSLPRRVLDLRRFPTEGKLCLLESEGMSGAYVCLSYTWGPRNNGVTTPDNLQANFNNISYVKLPQTYKDAVTVATALDIPFLWIDGLCIIQGDKDSVDWKEQSSQMAEIYGNSLLVIAAANCTSVEDGFLSAANTSRSLIKFELPRDTNAHSVVYARAMLDHSWLGWSTLAEPKTEGTLSRSWCFQEEVLASRILTFYGGEMNLQCLDSEYRCECEFPGSSLGLVTIKELYEPRLQLSNFETPNWMWQSTVEHYTRRRLTVATDRLVALSGVARVAQVALRTQYVAGHWWDSDFLCSLCWAPVRTKETERSFSKTYVAPSWSWASHNGPVTMWIPYAGSEEPITPRFLGKTAAREVSIVSTTQESAGSISSGSITVRGVFLDVVVEAGSKEQLAGVMMRNGEKIAFNFDRPLGTTTLADRPGGPEHICERVGFVDYETRDKLEFQKNDSNTT